MTDIHQYAGYARLSVAPMMGWTDRHCRFFHRILSRHTLLYTEMIAATALCKGRADHLLDFDPAEHPVAVQLGGCDPGALAEATVRAVERGYDEVNLNVGCPSARVRLGAFGAVLMRDPALVGRCVRAMQASAKGRRVSVKCRLGVDEQDTSRTFPRFVDHVTDAGATRVIVHARKAILGGLDPKRNREVPPLDYARAHTAVVRHPGVRIDLNGGLADPCAVRAALAQGFGGAMVGRAAYHRPHDLLARADSTLFEDPSCPAPSRAQVIDRMRPYIAAHLDRGGKLSDVTRHMLGLFAGVPGARCWRQVLSQAGTRTGAGLEVVDRAQERVAARAEPRRPA